MKSNKRNRASMYWAPKGIEKNKEHKELIPFSMRT